MFGLKPIVPHKPACRHCGTAVEPLHRCPKCGRRSILAFFVPRGMRM
jgi:tRNA(Ile2) C34 agmatinyltransferase TiaS